MAATSFLIVWAVIFAYAAGRVSASRRNTTTPRSAEKQRQQAYTRWYEGQLREDARLRAKQNPEAYKPHAAVNLLSGTGA